MQSKSKAEQLSRIEDQIKVNSKALREVVSKPAIGLSSFESSRRELLAKKYQRQLNDARARKKKLQLD